MSFRVGIDIGGTFTDAISVDDAGLMESAKSPTTPQDLTVGAMKVIDELARHCRLSRRQFLGQVATIVHGTTTGTNVLITRTGPKLGLIATKGHRDVIQLRRVPKEDMYDWRHPFPEPFIPRYLRLGIEERIGSQGQVVGTI